MLRLVPITMASACNYTIVGCWIAVLLYWLISARRTKRIIERQSYLSALSHRVPLVLSYLLMVTDRVPSPLNAKLIPRAGWIMAFGAAICLLGLFVTLWARRSLAGNWSGDVTFKQEHELIRTGPYRFVRHPIYTGLLAMCLGTAVAIGAVRCWLALPLMAMAFWIKIKQEERLLLRHFPEAYPAYQQQVKALVPFVI